jgi:hypothetical protein
MAIAHHSRESLKSQINSEESNSGDYLIEDWHCEIADLDDDGDVELPCPFDTSNTI